jgi:hypothetical protein
LGRDDFFAGGVYEAEFAVPYKGITVSGGLRTQVRSKDE